MLGLALVTYRVSKQEALKSLSGPEVDLAVASLVKTAVIDRPQETSRIVYRITIPGEDPAGFLPESSRQKITRVSPHVVDLAVEAVAPSAFGAEDEKDRPAGEFLEPNTYIQSDDDLVRRHARAAAGDETDPWKAAQLMEKWVFENLKKKNFSTLLASAAEVAKDLSGDCTEHAVLLAAMARARGIGSRVAVGLVYAPSLSAFAGHMWTEVEVSGAWFPLDATQGRGRVGADHIKFADSSFADGGDSTPLTPFMPLVTVLGKLKIEVRDVKHER
jgi:transglutaminase-like putative cysteine protease